MVRLNKTSLQASQIDKLLYQLAKVTSPKQPAQANAVLCEILGTEEQIMVAKRIAVIVLLSEGFSSYKISRILKLSETTIASIALKLTRGNYEAIQNSLGSSKKNYFAILEVLDSVLHLGGILPHYNGLDRYQGF